MDSLGKERERKEIQYDLFSGFLAGLGETEGLPVDFNGKLFHRLVDCATVYHDGRGCSPSATAWKAVRRFEVNSGQVLEISGHPPHRLPLCLCRKESHRFPHFACGNEQMDICTCREFVYTDFCTG